MALLVRAKAIVTCDTDAAQNGITFEQLGLIPNGTMLIDDGGIVAACHGEQVRHPERPDVLDLTGCVIVPGFVDAHTHPLFAGNRSEDFRARNEGREPPQGMLYTVRETRKALDDAGAFWETVAGRLKLMLAHGTTTAEVKTGYALTAAGELQLLDLINAHKDDAALPRLIATVLGAHALPPEFNDEKTYVDHLVAELLPKAKQHGAVYADAFCEPGFFSPAVTKSFLEAARSNGLRLRVHCDEMAYGGAAAMAARVGVDAADHCNYIREEDARALAGSGTVVVACPATIAYLGLTQHAPVRKFLENGGRVALASDYNPGTSPCFNMQTVAYYGRRIFGLTAAEALYATTRAAAQSLRVDAGRIAPGLRADFVALRLDSAQEFGWEFGGNLAAAVFRGGLRAA